MGQYKRLDDKKSAKIEFELGLGIQIQIPQGRLGCTKVCAVCGKKTQNGLCAIAIRDYHYDKRLHETRGRYYSPNCSYIHIECAEQACHLIMQKIKHNQEKIDKTMMNTIAKRI